EPIGDERCSLGDLLVRGLLVLVTPSPVLQSPLGHLRDRSGRGAPLATVCACRHRQPSSPAVLGSHNRSTCAGTPTHSSRRPVPPRPPTRRSTSCAKGDRQVTTDWPPGSSTSSPMPPDCAWSFSPCAGPCGCCRISRRGACRCCALCAGPTARGW